MRNVKIPTFVISLFILFAAPQILFASLGETLEQFKARYGEGKVTTLDSADRAAGGDIEYTFYNEHGRITAVFAGGKCVNLIYFTKDKSEIPKDKLGALMQDNAGGSQWRVMGTTGVPTHVTADESRFAVVKVDNVGFFDRQFWLALMKALRSR